MMDIPMRIRSPGKINDNLWFLGRMESCIYLLEGSRESMLINGGLTCLVPDILRQFQDFGIDESKITKILMLHSHFDHVGIVPFFKRRWPELTILSSPRALKVLTKPKVLESINDANRYATEHMGLIETCSSYHLDWTTEITGDSVREGDVIDLGDMEIVISETPGHSPCHISAYVPKLKVLFPSEAGGLPCGEKIITYGTSSYSDFEKSIQKIKDLPVQIICSDHYGYVTGEEAGSFIKNSIRKAYERRIFMQETYNKTRNIEKTASILADHFKDENAVGIIPYELFVEAQRQMILNVIGKR
jgi:glyoxylase-like metal-dependent hydrolase (beta-lactamase superfamily II)